MGFWDGLRSFFSLEGVEGLQERSDPFLELQPIEDQIAAIRRSGSLPPWRTPSIRDALGVPAIQRAVALITSTTGMLSIQGYRNGALMDETPKVIARPNPFQTPLEFYGGTAYCAASRGEFVWWIARRDSDDLASALVVVPLAELKVEDNPRNRLFPTYTWGEVTGTRYSPANPEGKFVHMKYPLTEPFALRGQGPLQYCGAATSVTVEAQEWAANFYAEGGHARETIKVAGEATEEEAAALKASWIEGPNNVPRVIDAGIEEVIDSVVNTQGAQMLDARQHQNGDAARMFGIPGSLLEYQQPGSSLTYQNLEGEFGKFVKTCLQPLYLEPIEQALSDLLPRSTAARFNVKGFERADAKTRAEIYNILVPLGVMSVEQAQEEEGIVAGNVEFAPVPFAPPAAVLSSIPQVRSVPEEIRCDGMTLKRRSGIPRLETCNALLSKTGVFSGGCWRCKKVHHIAAIEARSEVTLPILRVPEVTRIEPEVEPEPDMTVRELAGRLPDALAAFAAALPRPEPPVVNFHERAIHVEVPASQTTIAEGAIRVEVAAPEPANVTVNVPERSVEPAQVTIRQAAMPAETEAGQEIADTLRAIDAELRKPRIVDKEVIRDRDGRIVGVRETETR